MISDVDGHGIRTQVLIKNNVHWRIVLLVSLKNWAILRPMKTCQVWFVNLSNDTVCACQNTSSNV